MNQRTTGGNEWISVLQPVSETCVHIPAESKKCDLCWWLCTTLCLLPGSSPTPSYLGVGGGRGEEAGDGSEEGRKWGR